jgi:tetratricopeptide (TPR) repeat protein
MSLVRLFAADPNKFNELPEQERLPAADYLIDLAQKNVDYNKSDSLNQMMLAQILDAASRLVAGNTDKFLYYSDRALAAINDSIAASPERAPVYYQRAQIYLTRGEQDKAIETLREAYALNELYWDSACHLGRTMLFSENEEGYEFIGKCIDLGGANLLMPVGQLKSFAAYYKERGEGERVIKIYEQIVLAEPNNTANMVELAKLYAEAGYNEKAIEMALKISEKDPSVKNYITDFIEKLQ